MCVAYLYRINSTAGVLKTMKLLKSFSQLPAVKKDTIFGAAKKNFGPFYFVTALESNQRLICFEVPLSIIL